MRTLRCLMTIAIMITTGCGDNGAAASAVERSATRVAAGITPSCQEVPPQMRGEPKIARICELQTPGAHYVILRDSANHAVSVRQDSSQPMQDSASQLQREQLLLGDLGPVLASCRVADELSTQEVGRYADAYVVRQKFLKSSGVSTAILAVDPRLCKLGK